MATSNTTVAQPHFYYESDETPRSLTVDEFMDYVTRNPNKRVELVDGQIVAMTGGTSKHNIISLNCTDIKHFLRKNKSNCRVYSSDFGVQTKENQIRYPDFLVVCGAKDEDTFTTNPILVGEVLSKGNTSKEIKTKIAEYKEVYSIQEIFIVSQDKKEVIVHRRGQFFGWSTEVYTSGLVEFRSIGHSMDIDDIYYDVNI